MDKSMDHLCHVADFLDTLHGMTGKEEWSGEDLRELGWQLNQFPERFNCGAKADGE